MLRVVVVKGHKCRGAEVQGRVAASRAIEELYDCPGAGIDGCISRGRFIREVHKSLKLPARDIKGRRAGGRRVFEEEIAAHRGKIYQTTGSGAVLEKKCAGNE